MIIWGTLPSQAGIRSGNEGATHSTLIPQEIHREISLVHRRKCTIRRLSYCVSQSRRGSLLHTYIPPKTGQFQRHPIDPLNLEGNVMVAGSDSSPGWIRVCAWCGVLLPGAEPQPKSAAVQPVTTHGICPPCRDAFLRAPFDEGPAARSDASGPT